MIKQNRELNFKEVRQEEVLIVATVYSLFSSVFREPKSDFAAAKELSEIFSGELSDLKIEMGIPPQDVESQFRAVFSHNLSPDCPPYETQYGKSDVFRQTNNLADLAGFYNAFGVDTRNGACRPDHLSVELEFLSYLCLKEVRALGPKDDESFSICRKARSKFLGDHLARWVPEFAKAVLRKTPDGYYAGVSRALARFIAWDADMLKVDLKSVPQPQGVAIEEPDAACQSCFGGVS